jgi:hypothetical protein
MTDVEAGVFTGHSSQTFFHEPDLRISHRSQGLPKITAALIAAQAGER